MGQVLVIILNITEPQCFSLQVIISVIILSCDTLRQENNMKKSSSENFISKSPFTAKPPLSLSAMELRLGRPRPPGQSCSLPTSPLSESANFRSHSSSPGRHSSPDCVKLKLVAAGSSFCLVKDEPQVKPNDDINGRKSPFISTRTWPKALRTRSASKERISSKHGILYGSVEQIKAFQERKAPAVPSMSSLPRNPEKRKEDGNYPVRRSTSVLQIPPTEKVGEKQRPKGILKSTVSVPRVHERIQSYQSSIEENQSKRQSALPWANKLVSPEVSQRSNLRKTASSPCLFVKKNSVKIKTQKTPIKLFGTITSVSNLIGEKISQVRESESEQDEILREAPVLYSPTSRGNSREEYQIKIPQISNVLNQSTNTSEAKPNNNNMSKHFHSTYESNKTGLAMENRSNGLSHISQNNNLSQSNIQPVNSESTIRYREPPPPTNPHTEITSFPRSEPGSEPRTEPVTEPGTERTTTERLDKQGERPNITSSSITVHQNPDCFDPRRESEVCDTFNEDSWRQAGEECNITVTSPQQKLNEEQRNIYDSEHVNGVNSSEDEEIQKELTSILPNGRDKPELPQLLRPRFVRKPSRHCDKIPESERISERTSDSSDISNLTGDETEKSAEIQEVSSSGSPSRSAHCSEATRGSDRGKSTTRIY